MRTARQDEGPSKRQNGFGRFSRIYKALCNLTGKQRWEEMSRSQPDCQDSFEYWLAKASNEAIEAILL